METLSPRFSVRCEDGQGCYELFPHAELVLPKASSIANFLVEFDYVLKYKPEKKKQFCKKHFELEDRVDDNYSTGESIGGTDQGKA